MRLQLFDKKQKKKKKRDVVRGTTVIRGKTKIYWSESQMVSPGSSVECTLQGNEDYEVNVTSDL
jgi:hypothetical protein